jgi:hypothetical protein
MSLPGDAVLWAVAALEWASMTDSGSLDNLKDYGLVAVEPVGWGR